MGVMDSTGGDLNHAAKEIDAEIERNLSHNGSSDAVFSREQVLGEKQEQDLHSSGSSSEDITKLEKLDSHIVKVPEVKKEDEAYQHLPPHEREIVKRQLDIPTVSITFKTLYRYATTVDLIVIAVSSVCAIAAGAVMPLMTVSTRVQCAYPAS